MKEENEYEYEDKYDDEDNVNKQFSLKLFKEVFPLMYDAEINEPMEYWKNLLDLYVGQKPKKPEKKSLKELPKNINLNKIKNKNFIRNYDYIGNLDNMAYKQKLEEYISKVNDIKVELQAQNEKNNENIEKNEIQFDFFRAFLFFMFLIIAIWGVIYFDNPVTMWLRVICVLAAILFGFWFIMVFVSFKNGKVRLENKKKEFENKELVIEKINNDLKDTVDIANKEIDKIKEKIEAENEEIKKQNDEIMNSYSIEERNWENKIRNFEKRRIEDFNYLLEMALEKISQLEIDFGYSDEPRYILKYYDYPEDYEQYKRNYFKKIEEDEAKKNGTEMFLDLEE